MQADPRRDIDPHEIIPIKQFRSRVQLSSSSLMWGPFNEIMWFDGTRMIDGKPYPSQISVLADRPDYTKNFVPDYSIEFRTIRTIAAIDIFNGSVTPDQLAGKAVFISYIEPLNTKLTRIPGQGAATAAYANGHGRAVH